jgi:hypothetical protein
MVLNVMSLDKVLMRKILYDSLTSLQCDTHDKITHDKITHDKITHDKII